MGNDDVVSGGSRNRAHGVAALAGIILFGACAPLSVAPIVGDGAAIEVPGLAGKWVSEGDDTTTIAALRAGEYALSFTEKDERGTRFQARAGRLGEWLVLDVYAKPEMNEAAGLTETLLGTLIPGHVLVVLELQGDSIRAALLDQDSLKSAIRSGMLRTPSLDLDGTLVLTAPTDSLRAALAKYLGRPGALGEWGRFGRVRTAVSEGIP